MKNTRPYLLPEEEPIDSIDLVEPADAPTNIAVGRKSPIWAQQTLQDVERHEATHMALFGKAKDLRGSQVM